MEVKQKQDKHYQHVIGNNKSFRQQIVGGISLLGGKKKRVGALWTPASFWTPTMLERHCFPIASIEEAFAPRAIASHLMVPVVCHTGSICTQH